MKLHRYPGLFDEGVGRGLGTAVVVSLALHIGLFAAFGRFHIAPVDRTFYAPINMVDLVAKPPGAEAGPKSAAPGLAKPEAKPTPAPPPSPPAKKPQAEATRPVVKAPPKPAPPKPAPQEKVISTGPTPPVPAEPPTEERVAERIARLREKLGQAQPAAPKASEPPAGIAESKVRQAVESIRSRVQPGDGNGGKSGPGGLGIRGGSANVLQEVRLRAYYNRLWEHVNANWTIPPSLEGKGYTVIVSAVLDRRGRVLKATVEEPSVSAAFDQSALRALERASPLPEFPEEVKEDVIEVGFRFHGE